jgi:hypothetical protein
MSITSKQLTDILTDVQKVLSQHRLDTLKFEDQTAYNAFVQNLAATLSTWPDSEANKLVTAAKPLRVHKQLVDILSDTQTQLSQCSLEPLNFEDHEAYLVFVKGVASAFASWPQPAEFTRARAAHGDPAGILKS